MHPEGWQSVVSLKQSPFLVVKQLDNESRVYSKLHGNLTSYHFDITEVLKLFDRQIDIKTAVNEISKIYRSEPLSLIKELYEKRFLVEGNKNKENMLSEYVGDLKNKNKISKVSKVTFLVSAKCNLACKGCYHNFFNFQSTNMKSDFADQILKGLFPYLKRRGIRTLLVSFLGYEPLLNFETLRGIYDRTFNMGEEHGVKTLFRTHTNAFSITEEIFEWMGQNKSRLEIMVSLDGIREDNDKRRVDSFGRGTYVRVIENLKRIINAGVECGVLTVLSKLNFSNIERFVDEMAAIGIKNIIANIFCGHSNDERLMELTDLEKFEAIKRMELSTEKYNIGFGGEWKFAVAQMITGAHFFCPAGVKQLVFCADGVIYPCQRFAGTEVNFGTYEKDFWEKLDDGQCESYNRWTADLYNSITERTREDGNDFTGCGCPFLPFIRGECMSKYLEREFNEYLLEYYLTRPLNRILAKAITTMC